MDNRETMANESIYSIPQPFRERNRLREAIRVFVNGQAFTPPLSMNRLLSLSGSFILENGLDASIKGWITVEINNCIWEETVASVPYDKRILLLPQCLRNSVCCRAEIDEFGLLCNRCGRCSIPDLQNRADALGTMCLVAEGFTTVVELVGSGAVEAVIGVGCLDSLEKAFPLLIDNAIPGIAVPLNIDGCKDTDVDIRYVSGFLDRYVGNPSRPVDYEKIKADVKGWFSIEHLPEIPGGANDPASRIAREWLSGDGKRWRPYLMASLYAAITGKTELPKNVKPAALAVECFHKASLVHDDIQDNDEFRYGKQTVHSEHGIPVAINIGDILLGEGYRLLSLCGNIELIKTAAEAHIALCQGQGVELEWSRSPRELTLDFVVDICDKKTVPAFEVALIFGAVCAGEGASFRAVLHDFSRALGIAYQFRDDLDDFENDQPLSLRPSAVLAVLCEQNKDAGYIRKLQGESDIKPFLKSDGHQEALARAAARITALADEYHQQAIASLEVLNNREIKQLLFRVAKRILHSRKT
jgi:geranylgeranyl pyrophosphate synthase